MKHLLFVAVYTALMQIQAQKVKLPAEVVQENLEFYNQRNMEGFMSSFSDRIILFTYEKKEPIAKGKDEIKKLYKGLFEESPKLNSTILHRAVIGNKVIDHESIKGRRGSKKPIKLVMIYEVSDDKILRMTVIRE
jgi:hypothetical protein